MFSRSLLLLCLTVLALACTATALTSSRHYPEPGHVVRAPVGWERVHVDEAGDVPPLSLLIHVFQSNKDEMLRIATDVSNPRSSSYGRYLTAKQLEELVAPSNDALKRITKWLQSHGVNHWSFMGCRDVIQIQVTKQQAEQMFQCSMDVFYNDDLKMAVVKSEGVYSVPLELANDVELVTGLQHFPSQRKALRREGDADANVDVTPTLLRERYNVTLVSNSTTLKQAVAEFQGQFFLETDLVTFYDHFVTYAHNDKIVKTVGSNPQQQSQTEAALDAEFIQSVGAGLPLWFYSYASYDFWTDLTTFASDVSSESSPPNVISVSYGDQAYSDQPSVAYKHRLNDDFAKFATRGISVIFSSGDSGSGCDGSTCQHLEDNFPAASTWVTSVGATRFINGQNGAEEAVKFFGSGGGFSYVFARPSWQASVVEHYLQTNQNLPNSAYFNASGRGTPDVAALGANFKIVQNGQVEPGVYGTSCSAPTFSGIVSLLNDVQEKAGKPSLGFLNQWIYQTNAAHPDAFFDVTQGDQGQSCCGGFQCQAGWDPVTGVGTPNFAVLKTLLP